jgi:hypothetical protein
VDLAVIFVQGIKQHSTEIKIDFQSLQNFGIVADGVIVFYRPMKWLVMDA